MKLYGKKHALASLRQFADSGRMPHALMFYGAKGIGKHTLADYTAMMYVCGDRPNAPCMNCSACKRAEQHIHPDIVYPVPIIEETYRKPSCSKSMVDLMREFISSCYIKPNDGDVRVIIFEHLDALSVQMQNTLLKFIEEPLDFNRYIFLAENRSHVIQTVLSRVTSVEVDPADKSEFSRALTDNGIEPSRCGELYDLFAGNVGAALGYERAGGDVPYLTAALAACDAVADKNEYGCLCALMPLKVKDDFFAALGIMTDIFAQAAACKTGIEPTGSYRRQTVHAASALSLTALSGLYDETLRLYGMSFTNPNLKLFAAECCSSMFAVFDRKQRGNR